ncbi:hypothetical protein GJ744_000793 [Endocarpon pusillum]|uniref:Uncharacterized protein n=1 Tax=Endocarpon pusillum TaxID=364733 RepID=A0A8H7E7W9_9EURO|nr:hypothetical protein GJ744_000793 [Endocarpon pusillum]
MAASAPRLATGPRLTHYYLCDGSWLLGSTATSHYVTALREPSGTLAFFFHFMEIHDLPLRHSVVTVTILETQLRYKLAVTNDMNGSINQKGSEGRVRKTDFGSGRGL